MRSAGKFLSVALAVSALALAPAMAVAKDKGSSASSSGNGNNGNANGASGNGNGNGNNGNGNGNGGSSSSGSSGSSGSSSGSSSSSSNNGNGGSSSGGVVVVTPPPATCGLNDISITASACGGFFAGNLLNNSPSDVTAQTSALAALGLTAWDGSIVEPQLSLSTSTVNFGTALYGLTYVGIHFGAGTTSPSPHTPGGVTGFYRFDAGLNLDSFNLAFGSASGARLYVTQAAPPPAPIVPPVTPDPVIDPPYTPPPAPNPPLSIPFDPPGAAIAAVPEPATWLMMILGFGGVGAILRRRRAQVAA